MSIKLPLSITTDCNNRILVKHAPNVSGVITYKPATKRQLERIFKCRVTKLPFKYDDGLKCYVSIGILEQREEKLRWHQSNVAKIKLCFSCGLIKRSTGFTSIYIRDKGKRKTLRTCNDCNDGVTEECNDEWLERIREDFYTGIGVETALY